MYAITNPGVNALRGPVYNEMINVVNDRLVTFENYKFDKNQIKLSFENYRFTNQRPIIKSMPVWWVFVHTDQQLLNNDTKFDIEHVFPKNMQNKGEDSVLKNIDNL